MKKTVRFIVMVACIVGMAMLLQADDVAEVTKDYVRLRAAGLLFGPELAPQFARGEYYRVGYTSKTTRDREEQSETVYNHYTEAELQGARSALVATLANLDALIADTAGGACCTDVVCEDSVTKWTCEERGDVYKGDGTTCRSVSCP